MALDLRIDVNYFGHWKTRKLEKLLPGGAAAFMELWRWCAITPGREKGDLGGLRDDEIDLIPCLFPRDGLAVALAEAHYLDGPPGARVIHEFPIHQPYVSGPVAEKRSAAARKAGLASAAARRRSTDRIEPSTTGQRDVDATLTRRSPSPSPSPSPVSSSGVEDPTPTEDTRPRPPQAADEDPSAGVQGVLEVEDVEAPDDGGDTAGHEEPPDAPDACPLQAIIDAYHRLLPVAPRITDRGESARAYVRARWREDPARQNLAWWRAYFQGVAASDFLAGRKADFVADLEWLARPRNMAKVLAGRYVNKGGGAPSVERQSVTTDARYIPDDPRETGRRFKKRYRYPNGESVPIRVYQDDGSQEPWRAGDEDHPDLIREE